MITASFKALLEQISQTGEPVTTTPRSLLGHYGYVRRGRWINATIRSALREHGLLSNPDFETAWIDGQIRLERGPSQSNGGAVTPDAAAPVLERWPRLLRQIFREVKCSPAG